VQLDGQAHGLVELLQLEHHPGRRAGILARQRHLGGTAPGQLLLPDGIQHFLPGLVGPVLARLERAAGREHADRDVRPHDDDLVGPLRWLEVVAGLPLGGSAGAAGERHQADEQGSIAHMPPPGRMPSRAVLFPLLV
jgi:hypothetical protein